MKMSLHLAWREPAKFVTADVRVCGTENEFVLNFYKLLYDSEDVPHASKSLHCDNGASRVPLPVTPTCWQTGSLATGPGHCPQCIGDWGVCSDKVKVPYILLIPHPPVPPTTTPHHWCSGRGRCPGWEHGAVTDRAHLPHLLHPHHYPFHPKEQTQWTLWEKHKQASKLIIQAALSSMPLIHCTS